MSFRSTLLLFVTVVMELIPLPASMAEKRKLAPNETGRVMILMYHGIGERESTWVRTPENFKKDLKMLYEKGYRPISLRDFVNNDIDTPHGYTPVVLTFDDGTRQQFNLIEGDGKAPQVDPKSAVGMLEEFHAQHPDFPLEATFFLNNSTPFEQKELVSYKLNYLIRRGMDIGNHSSGHQDLSDPKYHRAKTIQEIVGKQTVFLENAITEFPEYRVDTFALCYGKRPKGGRLQQLLKTGVFEDHSYRNTAILNVGSGPSPAPIDKKFYRYALPRIRASEVKIGRFGMRSWLRHFDRAYHDRYVSDGDPNTIAVPRRFARKVRKDHTNGKTVVIYD